jgi:hypothetical protein
MKISLDLALRNGWNRMAAILFRPFDLVKWLIIGFASFLAALGQGRGLNFNFPTGDSFGDGGQGDLQAVESWFRENLIAIVLIGLGVLLVVFALSLLILWLSSRGRFIFLHTILNNKAEIKVPWTKYGHLGDRLFLFRLVFGLITFLTILAVLGGGILLLLPYFQSETFSAAFFIILMSLILLFVVLIFCALSVKVILMDFVVPVMFKRGTSVVPSFSIFYNEFLKGHMWDFTIFYLLKFALGIAAGVVTMLVTIFTCCLCCFLCIPFLGWYIAAVVFLPIAVFIESFTLSYMAQFGDGNEWDLFTWKLAEDAPPAPPSKEEIPPAPAVQEEPKPSPETPEI